MSGLLQLIPALANSPNVSHNDEQTSIISLNIAFITVTASIILTRIAVRAFVVKHVAVDDYLMIAAGIFATILSAMSIYGTRYGLGHHIWDLPLATIIPHLKRVIQSLWICQVMYATALTLVKLSIISSYHRLFPTPAIRRTLIVLALLILAVWAVLIFSTIFQCTPIQSAWNFEIKGQCISVMNVYYFTTAFSILTDILLVCIPLPLFWKLPLPKREKWIVTVLFALGLFASVASIMRITVLHDVQSTDATFGAVATLNWSVVEVGTGIICACVPCLKPLVKSWLPSRFATLPERDRGVVVQEEIHGPVVVDAEELRRLDTEEKEGRMLNFSRPSTTKQGVWTGVREFV